MRKVSKTTKSISFVVGWSDGTGIALETQEVDLGRLTGLSKVLAELICTTENADSLSKVIIRSSKTNEDLLREEGKTEEEIKHIRNIWGNETLKSYPITAWKWDLKSCYETPENYIKRQAAKMYELKGTVIGTLHKELEEPIILSI